MTIINNIEIDNINYKRNEIKEAILNNDPIEEKLNVIIVVSNPCQYARRYILAREFIKRIENDETNVNLYVVELAHNKDGFYVTKSTNPNHLQIRTTTAPLWHKENLINIGVKKLLPQSWKAFAWIDADVEFENPSWALDTLKVLNGCKDVVQLFSHCVDMNKDELTMSVFNSFGYQYTKKNQYTGKGLNYWHPGYAYACTRKAYEKMGGLYDLGVLGSGDNIMAMSFIDKVNKILNYDYTEEYKESMYKFQKNTNHLRFGYIPGVIRHYFHGTKANRRYTERWQILIRHKYNPETYIRKNEIGLLVPTENCPKEFLNDILRYFKERNEDEGF